MRDLQSQLAAFGAQREDWDAREQRLLAQIADSERREKEAQSSIAALDGQLKNAQTDLRMMYRRHQSEMAELQQQLAQDDLRGKYAAAMQACASMREQVATALGLLDVTFAAELPLSEAVGDEVQQVFAALQEQSELLTRQQARQREQVDAANRLVEQTHNEHSKVCFFLRACAQCLQSYLF